jgi:ADP-dependent NAD(P)H-hydrate dehydratase / NAD(P)H-hydrate epimerase
LERTNTVLVASTGQLQKLVQAVHSEQALTVTMDLLRLIAALHNFSMKYPSIIVTQHIGTTLVAHRGQLSSTQNASGEDLWQVKAAAKAAVLWLQNPSKPFESITTAQIIDD